MRAKDFLVEGRGIAARIPGDIFYKDDDDFITLEEVIYLPEERGEFESKDKLEKEYESWKDDFKGEVTMYGLKNLSTKAAMISIWVHSSGKKVAYGRWFKKINQGMIGAYWPNTDFQRDTGYGSEDDKTVTQRLPIKPSDILPDAKLASSEVVKIVQKQLEQVDVDKKIKDQMVQMIQNAINGDKTPIQGAAKNSRLHEVYTAEYAAPLVFIYNSPLVIGDKDKVTKMLAKLNIDHSMFSKISWPTNAQEKLIDSYIHAENFKLGISSKAKKGGGAGASIDGVFQIIRSKKDKMPETFLRKYKSVLDTIDVLMTYNSIDGIIKLCENMKVINAQQGIEIKDRMQTFDNNRESLIPQNKQLLEKSKNRYNPKTDHPNYNVGYHMLAVLARYVADDLKQRDIDGFFRGVLAYADMIQIYASVHKKKDSAWFDSFTVKYPPEFDGKIIIDPDTNYFATSKPKGRITFKLK